MPQWPPLPVKHRPSTTTSRSKRCVSQTSPPQLPSQLSGDATVTSSFFALMVDPARPLGKRSRNPAHLAHRRSGRADTDGCPNTWSGTPGRRGLEPAFGVLFTDRLIEGLPVGAFDAFAVGSFA